MDKVILPDSAWSREIHKILLSGPVKNSEYTRGEAQRKGDVFQVSLYTKKQVFHHNKKTDETKNFIETLLTAHFTHYTARDTQYEYAARVTKKGKILTTRKLNRPNQSTGQTTPPTTQNETNFNRQKNHILQEGMDIPVLTDMGIFTKELKIAVPMRDKFIQINRFLELISDETRHLTPEKTLNIIDFGCGKSYLTFVIYHYFTAMRGLQVHMAGLDTDETLIQKCNTAAQKYKYTNLTFQPGDIGQQKKPPLENWGKKNSFNIIISLHACDTATDHALYNAVAWQTDLICAVPCCQHELRNQMQKDKLALFSRYGIIQERVASLATDAIRAALLESQGYKVKIIELTDRENTAKNLMLRARKTNKTQGCITTRNAALEMIETFGFKPTFWTLFEHKK